MLGKAATLRFRKVIDRFRGHTFWARYRSALDGPEVALLRLAVGWHTFILQVSAPGTTAYR